MKYGFTTGSCAAAAAKAATVMLLTGKEVKHTDIITPSSETFDADITDAEIGGGYAVCAVKKPANDDPDVTAGMLIYAKAELIRDGMGEVTTEGGAGIGKVTKPGLDRPVGEAAINTVPRKMIEEEVRAVMEECECTDSVRIVISAPDGEKIAEKTFNPRLGIEGGISIIGTSGIVEPMSTKAVLDTIKVQLRQQHELGSTMAVVSPGNYGVGFMRDHFGYDLDRAVKCSNYIGETIDIAKELGYGKMLIAGHAGKLVKLSGGIMNTHSKEADCRMELMAAAAAKAGAETSVILKILDCVSTDEAYAVMLGAGVEKKSFEYISERIGYHLKKRAGDMLIACIVYSNLYGLLGCAGDTDIIRELKS